MKRSWRNAAETGDAAGLRALLERGERVDSRDRYGQTALMLAARGGHLEAVRVLIEAGADLDHTAKYRLSALMLATIHDHLEVVRALVDAGANAAITGSGAPGFAGKTALHIADELGRRAISDLLRGAGA